MTNITLLVKKPNSIDATAVDKLLAHLFADKRAIYIDDINFSSDGGYDVSWCLEFTLKMTNPQWMDTHLERAPLIQFIRTQNLNQWEAYKYCEHTGNVQAYTETTADLETFLDENYHEVIQKFLESESPGSR
jgi:hypothetical protein